MNKKVLFFLVLALALADGGLSFRGGAHAESAASKPIHAEVVVYGGTPGGVIAAVAAARHGHTVALVDLNNHVGGVVSGGLCASDMGDRRTVGGYSIEFFDRIVKYYTDTYGADSEQVKRSANGIRFEPHIAEKVFNDMIAGQKPRITVYSKCRYKSSTVTDGKVTSLVTDCLTDGSVKTFTGDIFIDASYEGDLMAGAKVPYTVGRESRDQYGEAIAGVGIGPDKGKADKLLMAYNYRLCITTDPNNKIPYPKPEHYDKTKWAALYGPRIAKGKVAKVTDVWADPARTNGPNQKFDWNSDDMEGTSTDYPEGDWATRDKIAQIQKDYILSKIYYLQGDPELPQAWRDEAGKWGFAKDEFVDTGGFPFQLYIREARRMVGAYVLTLNDIAVDRYKPDGICAGSYGTDCHIVRRINIDGKDEVDHTLHIDLIGYDIPYGCIIPRGQPTNLLVPVCCSASHVAYCSVRMEPVYMMLGQAAGDAAHLAIVNKTSVQKVNVKELRALLLQEKALLDIGYIPPVKISFTPAHPKPGEEVQFHAVVGELKDPIKNITWDFEGTGAVGAQGADAKHTFSLEKIHHVSLVAEDRQGRLRLVEADVPVGAAKPLDVTVDDLDARMDGRWAPAAPVLPGIRDLRLADVMYGPSASYDAVVRGKKKDGTGVFTPNLPRDGRYQVCFGYRPNPHNASNTPVTINCSGTPTKLTIDQRKKDSPFPFVSLGEFTCKAGTGSSLEIDNEGADDRIMVDAVRWVWLGE